MRYRVRPSEADTSSLLPDLEMALTYDRREDARLAAEVCAGKAVCSFEVVEVLDDGSEGRVEEYDFEEGWLAPLR
jgi:hypothetical protein